MYLPNPFVPGKDAIQGRFFKDNKAGLNLGTIQR